ncbi:MFS transporter [Cohnella panacarvi]|uniref:MFS transporter n=1 Tax=Cohnella panacarvi TaxID=400776 RepID=UPI00047B384F|nr:MFS transporter [Cohnella panacarvi]
MEIATKKQIRMTGRSAKTLLLAGIAIGYFMVLLDMTVVSVALPAIHEDLGGSIRDLQWIVNAFTIAFAGLLLSMGTVADKWGARRTYIAGLIVLFIASAASANVSSLGTLIVLRALLGAGGAAVLPASLTLIAHSFPDPAERARAIGSWAAVTGIAMAAGPVAGGILVDTFGWRSVFLLNVPLAAVSLLLAALYIGEGNRKPQLSVDLAGQITAIAAIAALSYALMEGGNFGWGSPVIMGAFGLAFISASLFVMAESKGKAPLLPLRLFRNSTVSAGMIAGLAINLGFSGILFIMPLFFQQELAQTARSAGLSLLPMMIPMAVNPLFTGRLVGKIGPRLPMTLGFGLGMIGASLLIGIDESSGYGLTFVGLLLCGFGVSFTLPSLVAAVISSVPKEQAGAASGALNSSRQLGATLGVAIYGAIVSGGGTFIAGMRVSLIVTAVIMACGGLLSFAFVNRNRM